MSDRLVSQTNIDSKFLITLFRRFSERRESLVRELSKLPFIKAVKKVFKIKQAKYLRYAIKYFPNPYQGVNFDYGTSLERITKFIFHLKTIGIRKVLDGRCMYVTIVDNVQKIKLSTCDVASLNHSRDFKVDVDFVQQLIVLLGEKIEVLDYFSRIGLNGGGKYVGHTKRYNMHCGIRRGTNSFYYVPLMRALSFYMTDFNCYNEHLTRFGGCLPLFLTIKVVAESISDNNGNVRVSLFDIHYPDEYFIDCSAFTKKRYYHIYKINLRGYSVAKFARSYIKIHFDPFDGASYISPQLDVFFYDPARNVPGENYTEFSDLTCSCEKIDPLIFKANTLMLSSFYDVMGENGFSFCRPFPAIIPQRWREDYEMQNLSYLGSPDRCICCVCKTYRDCARLVCGHSMCNACFKKRFHRNMLLFECDCGQPLSMSLDQPERLTLDQYFNDAFGVVSQILREKEKNFVERFRGKSLLFYLERGKKQLIVIVDGVEVVYSLD